MLQTPTYSLPYPEGADPADGPTQIRNLAERVETVLTPIDLKMEVPIGSIMMWMVATAPANWLLCNGQQVPASSWEALEDVLGSAGTPALITLPDLVGRVPLGTSAGHALGQKDGAETVALSTAQLPTHAHGVNDAAHQHGGTTAGCGSTLDHTHSYISTHQASAGPRGTPNGYAANANNESVAFTNHFHNGYWAASTGHGSNLDHAHGFATDWRYSGVSIKDTGDGLSHNNMPPFLAINFIMRGR